MNAKVLHKVESAWPDPQQRDQAYGILRRYKGDGSTPGQTRVQLAMLKLAQGSLDELLDLLEVADRDFRDVVAPAESPEELRSTHIIKRHLTASEQAEVERIRKRDRQQYKRWLAE